MNAYLLFAYDLHKARHNDLLWQAAEDRLFRAAPAKTTPWWAHLALVALTALLGGSYRRYLPVC